MVELMLVHVVLAGGGTIIHYEIVLILPPVPLHTILGIAMLHHHDAPPTRRCVVVREARRLLAYHPGRQRRYKSPPIRRDGGIPHA